MEEIIGRGDESISRLSGDSVALSVRAILSNERVLREFRGDGDANGTECLQRAIVRVDASTGRDATGPIAGLDRGEVRGVAGERQACWIFTASVGDFESASQRADCRRRVPRASAF